MMGDKRVDRAKQVPFLLQHVTGCSMFGMIQSVFSDYGGLLELHGVTQAAHSSVLLRICILWCAAFYS